MIEFGEVSFSYRRNSLFTDLDLKIPSGSVTGVIGPNGSGKSTICKMIAGLVRPRTGSVSVRDEHPWQRSRSFLENLVYVPDTTRPPDITIERMPHFFGHFYPRFDQNLYSELVEAFQLPANKTLHHVSYGEQKKSLLAFAFATKASYLVLDEPTNGLDGEGQRIFRQALVRSHEQQRTVIFATHQIKSMENLFDMVVIVDHGKLILSTGTKELGARFTVRDADDNPGPNDVYWQDQPFGRRFLSIRQPGDKLVNFDLEFLYAACLADHKAVRTALETRGD